MELLMPHALILQTAKALALWPVQTLVVVDWLARALLMLPMWVAVALKAVASVMPQLLVHGLAMSSAQLTVLAAPCW